MPERITGEPDQFEQTLKDYCEERFGEARPVETVWGKLALELEANGEEIGPDAEFVSQTGSTGRSSATETGDLPVSFPVWRRQGKFALVAGLAVAALTGLVVMALVLATAQGQPKQQTDTDVLLASTPITSPKAVPTLTPQASGTLNLTYPGSRQLSLDPKDPWPFDPLELPPGITRSEQKAALASPDAYTQVVEYYRQLLVKAGFTIYASGNTVGMCAGSDCGAAGPNITNLTANKGPQQIGIMVLSPQSWLLLSASIYMYIGEQAKATETVVLINVTGPISTVAPSASVRGDPNPSITPPPATVKSDSEPAIVSTPETTSTPGTTLATTTIANVPVTPPAGYPNLVYPGAKQLTLKDGGPWITGQLDLNGKSVTGRIALAASGGYTKIIVYYQQRLSQAGFAIPLPTGVPMTCSAFTCYGPTDSIKHFMANKGKLHIEVMTYEAQDWNSAPLKLAAQLNLDGQILAPDTLVLITLASDN